MNISYGFSEMHALDCQASGACRAGCMQGLTKSPGLGANGNNTASQLHSTAFALHVHFIGADMAHRGQACWLLGVLLICWRALRNPARPMLTHALRTAAAWLGPHSDGKMLYGTSIHV